MASPYSSGGSGSKFEDDDREGGKKKRSSPVEKAQVSDSAKRKSDTKKTEEGFCVHSFRTLMETWGR